MACRWVSAIVHVVDDHSEVVGANKGALTMAVSRRDGARAEWQGRRTSQEAQMTGMRGQPSHLPIMSLDRIDTSIETAAAAPLVATVAYEELVARRIETLLRADGLLIARREQRKANVLVMSFGRGITERDQSMRRARRDLPRTHLVAVIPEDSRRGVRRALEAGAAGVVFEAELETALVPTVRAALAGQVAVPAVRRHEIDRPTLSSREKQVLGMVVMGMSNKAIAAELFLAESTVKCHLSSAFTKLGVRSRHEATDLILQSGSDVGLEWSRQTSTQPRKEAQR
jgi:DNA-binding NarL/FixJ family response regulator